MSEDSTKIAPESTGNDTVADVDSNSCSPPKEGTNADLTNSNTDASKEEDDEEEVDERMEVDNGNDGSVSDNEEDDGEDDDSAQGIPKGGLHWQSDSRSASRASSDASPVPSLGAAPSSEEAANAAPQSQADKVAEGAEAITSDTNTATSEPDKKRKRTEDKDAASTAPAPHSKLNEYQRQLRNAREKRRSGKICDQFDQIRDAMVKAGVIVPKGTKGTILAAAREYIALLQEQQRRVVLDNCMLVHQVQKIGEGALGNVASNAVRHVAAKNGVSDIVWPNGRNKENQNKPPLAAATAVPDYAGAFWKSPVAMAIATLGGSFVDCNEQFCQLTSLDKQQVTSQTIFTLVDQEELTNAFDRISQWLFSMNSSSGDGTVANSVQKPILLKSILKDANNCNLQVSLTPVKEKGAPRYLCATLTPRPSFAQQANQLQQVTTNQTLPVDATAATPQQKTDLNHNTFYAVG